MTDPIIRPSVVIGDLVVAIAESFEGSSKVLILGESATVYDGKGVILWTKGQAMALAAAIEVLASELKETM